MLNATPGEVLVSTASEIVESVAYRQSRSIYTYDLALQQGFGIHAKSWRLESSEGPKIIEMQTRDGAGLSIVGRLSGSTSTEGSFVLSAFTTLEGLVQMVPALSSLSLPNISNQLVLHVPGLSIRHQHLGPSPSLAPLAGVLPAMHENLAIILSSTPQEAVDLASVAYATNTFHVIHIFDHFTRSRELRKLTYPSLPSQDVPIEEALANFGYSPFAYTGPDHPSEVIIVLNSTLGGLVKSAVQASETVGAIAVLLLRPWDSAALLEVIPSSAKIVHVIDEVVSSYGATPLYDDVLGAVLEASPPSKLSVKSLQVTAEELHGYVASFNSFKKHLVSSVPILLHTTTSTTSTIKKVALYGTPGNSLNALPQSIARSFLKSESMITRMVTNGDAFSAPGGVFMSRIAIASKIGNSEAPEAPLEVLIASGRPAARLAKDSSLLTDFTVVLDAALLKSHDILHSAREQTPVLIFTSQKPEELANNLPHSVKSLVEDRDLRLFVVDAKAIPDASTEVQKAVAQTAFLRLYIGGEGGKERVERVARALVGPEVDGTRTDGIINACCDSLREVVWERTTDSDEASTKDHEKLRSFEFNSISLAGFDDLVAKSEMNAPTSSPWHSAAKHLLFPEAYAPSEEENLFALRPEVPTKTYLTTVSVNRRLTPRSYNRNVFHMEFDTKGTGLRYELGEALGIHGWNDDQDVLDFCKWYGVDPNALISVPLASTQGGDGKSGSGGHKVTRTVFQALQQQIDIFGRPPKSFFAALATYAKDRRHKMALQFISAPEGAATLKKLGEKDTVSYVDVLALYPSARPSVEELAVIVGEIKERHYSIASAQSVVGDRVDLLVVTVDWVTPSGTPKYGQCTRYLANLKPGTKVTVSIKPSVMKLPPSDLQPIIMAGLGTGAAPFRAFIQHRNLIKVSGKPVGPMVYYFGSRHRSQEYLYGEEIEAYIKDGIITHAGLAFSRDSDSKVYIQHKMKQDGPYLASLLAEQSEQSLEAVNWEKKGVFYLCGPTWPVPDVYETLVESLASYAGMSKDGAADYLESLKEKERYVLEVY